jgi:hypothetical protein
LNFAESPDDKKISAEEKDYDSRFGRLALATHVSVDPEPTTGRKPPALLAFTLFGGTDLEPLSTGTEFP